MSFGSLPKSILFLADQPFQTELMIEIIRSFKEAKFSNHMCLFICDCFSILHDSQSIHSMKTNPTFELVTLESEYRLWQKTSAINSNLENSNYINKWYEKYKPHRTIDELFKTNQLIYSWEREFYYFKLSHEWKLQIFRDLIFKMEKVFFDCKPDLVISIERNNFLQNIAYEMCNKLQIPFLTVLHSRIKNIWCISDTLGLESIWKNHSSFQIPSTVYDEVESFLSEKVQNPPSYSAIANDISLTMNGNFLERLPYILGKDFSDFVPNLPEIIKKSLIRILNRYSNYAIKPRRLEENLFRLTLWELRQFFFYYSRIIGFFKYLNFKEIDKEFFLWNLHARPEDSVSVLGLGIDELELILEFVQKLPSNVYLILKENPLSFGTRTRKSLKKIRNNQKILIVDTFTSTSEILNHRNCLGAVGLSGTTLLESSFVGKPSFAFGVPEFKKFLHTQEESVEIYIEKCLKRSYSPNDIKNDIRDYLSKVFYSGTNLRLDAKSRSSDNKTRIFSKTVTRKILMYWDEYHRT